MSRPDTRLDTIDRALATLRDGGALIVVDDVSRENEGDLIFPAATATVDRLAFSIRYSSGIICAPMSGRELDRLAIPMMTERNTDPKRTAFTLSADARTGVSTGVSAADRARTLHVLADPASSPADLVHPGHVFPGPRGRGSGPEGPHRGRRRSHASSRAPSGRSARRGRQR